VNDVKLVEQGLGRDASRRPFHSEMAAQPSPVIPRSQGEHSMDAMRYPEWQGPFREALLEIDREKLLTKMMKAEEAIFVRLQQLALLAVEFAASSKIASVYYAPLSSSSRLSWTKVLSGRMPLSTT